MDSLAHVHRVIITYNAHKRTESLFMPKCFQEHHAALCNMRFTASALRVWCKEQIDRWLFRLEDVPRLLCYEGELSNFVVG